MTNNLLDPNHAYGALGGVTFGLITLPTNTEILGAIILAFIGGIVGFIASNISKAIWSYIKKKF